jgi:hypothetical protein
MITLNHSINLVTEIDENLMPDDLLNIFLNLNEKEMKSLLAQTFIAGLNHLNVFDKLNDGNAYAIVKAGSN